MTGFIQYKQIDTRRLYKADTIFWAYNNKSNIFSTYSFPFLTFGGLSFALFYRNFSDTGIFSVHAEGSACSEKKISTLPEGSGGFKKKYFSLSEGSGGSKKKYFNPSEGSGDSKKKYFNPPEGSGDSKKKYFNPPEGSAFSKKMRLETP